MRRPLHCQTARPDRGAAARQPSTAPTLPPHNTHSRHAHPCLPTPLRAYHFQCDRLADQDAWLREQVALALAKPVADSAAEVADRGFFYTLSLLLEQMDGVLEGAGQR